MAMPLERKSLPRLLTSLPIIDEDEWTPIYCSSDPPMLNSLGYATAMRYHFYRIYVEAPTSFQESAGRTVQQFAPN
jgi:hypothetical protein